MKARHAFCTGALAQSNGGCLVRLSGGRLRLRSTSQWVSRSSHLADEAEGPCYKGTPERGSRVWFVVSSCNNPLQHSGVSSTLSARPAAGGVNPTSRSLK